METLTPARKKRKSVPEGHTASLDVPATHKGELHQKRKKETKKRRMEAECVETIDGGRGQDHASSTSTQETQRKKKKKKAEVVVIVEEEEEQESDGKVSVVIVEGKKKKKPRNRTVEKNVAVVKTNNNGQNPVGALSKKQNKKKKSRVVVTQATDYRTPDSTPDSPPEAALSEERLGRAPVTQGALLGAAPVHKRKKRRRKMEELENSEELETRKYLDGVAELLTYIPDIGSRSPEIIQKMLRQDLSRFREFRKKGIELRWGRFLKLENLKIKENVANFLALTGIATANELFYPERYTEHMDNIKRLRVLHSFQQRIAEDVPRPCFKVYTRGKKIFDDLNYMGRFTEDENRKLQKLQRIHGNDWKTISHGMDRSTFSLQKRFNGMATASGLWSQEEVDLLVGAMKLHLEKLAGKNRPGSDGGADAGPGQLWLTKRQLYNKLPWKSISEKVAVRSWIQCREKWFSILKPKLAARQKQVRSGGVQSVLSKITLINTLYAMGLEDAAEIDWEEVADSLGNVTPHTAQKIFNCLKVTRVPHSSVLSFCELIDFLHDKVVPMLRMKISSYPLQQEQVVRHSYLLSDIFSDEEYMELDNTA